MLTSLILFGGQIGGQLLSYHNIAYQMRLMRQIRAAIADQTLPEFVRTFFKRQLPKGDYPAWARDALLVAGIEI